MEHYQWGAKLKIQNKLTHAGPTDYDFISTKKISPIDHITGLIMLNVETREEAKEWAEKAPFHLHGYRKNVVYSMKITMTDNSLQERLLKTKKKHE